MPGSALPASDTERAYTPARTLLAGQTWEPHGTAKAAACTPARNRGTEAGEDNTADTRGRTCPAVAWQRTGRASGVASAADENTASGVRTQAVVVVGTPPARRTSYHSCSLLILL